MSVDLYKIWADKDKRLSLTELKQTLYEIKSDCINRAEKSNFYNGESNAIQIALDLLERLEVTKIPEKEQIRKETAKEILQEWIDDKRSMGEDIAYVKYIAKKYGVEVDILRVAKEYKVRLDK